MVLYALEINVDPSQKTFKEKNKKNMSDVEKNDTKTEWQTSTTSRGFNIVRFTDAYGADCSVQESSSVLPSLWIGTGDDRMHLRADDVERLIVVLQTWLQKVDADE